MTAARVRPRLRGVLVSLAGVLISVVAVALIVRGVDLGAAAGALGHADPLYIAIGIGVLGIGLVLRVVRWQRLLPARPDGTRIPARRILPALLVGYLGNSVLPARLGEPIRAYLLSTREGIPFGAAFGSVVLERIVDTATLAVLAFVAALGVAGPAWVVQGTGIAAIVAIGVVGLLATTGLGFLLPIARAVVARIPGGRRLQPVLPFLERFVYWSGGAHRRPVVLAAAAISLVAWLCDTSVFWFVARALGIDLSLSSALLIATITVLSTAIPSAPGYVGTYELATVSVAGFLGVASGPALALAVLSHLIGVLPSALGGAAALVSLGGGLRRISEAALEERTLGLADPGTGRPT